MSSGSVAVSKGYAARSFLVHSTACAAGTRRTAMTRCASWTARSGATRSAC